MPLWGGYGTVIADGTPLRVVPLAKSQWYIHPIEELPLVTYCSNITLEFCILRAAIKLSNILFLFTFEYYIL